MLDRCMPQTFAMILAGGEGRRLWPLTRGCCKPALPFGATNRVIDFVLSNCVHSKLEHIAVLTQYESAPLTSHIEQRWAGAAQRSGARLYLWPADTRPAGRYAGTANAVAQNLERLDPAFRDVLVLAGDHVYRMDYGALLETHRSRGADITVACVEVGRSDAHAFGVVSVDGQGRIVRFEEKPERPASIPGKPERSLASMGVYLFDRAVLEECLAHAPLDFGRDVLPDRISQLRVFAHRFSDPVDPALDYWRDVGTIDAYWRTLIDFVGSCPPFNLLDRRWPLSAHPGGATDLGLDGTRAATVSGTVWADPRVDLAGVDATRSVLGLDVTLGAGARISESIVLDRARIGAGCHLHRTIVGPGCALPEGTIVNGDNEVVRVGSRSAGGVLVVTAEDVSRIRRLPHSPADHGAAVESGLLGARQMSNARLVPTCAISHGRAR